MGQIINGKEVATKVKDEIKSYVLKRTEDGKSKRKELTSL